MKADEASDVARFATTVKTTVPSNEFLWSKEMACGIRAIGCHTSLRMQSDGPYFKS